MKTHIYKVQLTYLIYYPKKRIYLISEELAQMGTVYRIRNGLFIHSPNKIMIIRPNKGKEERTSA